MKVDMIGIDHSIAGIELREKFALTKSRLIKSLRDIKDKYNLSGVVIISTCNRTEIWVSNFCEEISLYEMICSIFDIDDLEYSEYFTIRHGIDAVDHLFQLSCGLKSMIIGEDQILTQVRESADIARSEKTIDSVLEKLFQIGVTSAKRVKTTTRLTAVDNSVATKTVELLRSIYGDINNLKCLVIGSGKIGRLISEELISQGCVVYMTIRKYKKGTSVIPKGCKTLEYDHRMNYLDLDVIVSSTLSPHFTLELDKVVDVIDRGKRVFVDLAMPRDIDPRIGELPGVLLYDIDSLSCGIESENIKSRIKYARGIISKYINDFERYYYNKDIKNKYIH
ncbi:MAG: glutamyl-tRNA reductase [Clostridium sp.]